MLLLQILFISVIVLPTSIVPTGQQLRWEVDDGKNKDHRLPTFKLVTENVINVRSHAGELVGG